MVDSRQDILMHSLSNASILASSKCFLAKTPTLNPEDSNWVCKLTLNPKLGTEAEVKVVLKRVDQLTLYLEYKFESDRNHSDSLTELLFCGTSTTLPGKTVVYSILKLDASAFSAYSEAEAQAEFMLSTLQLLDDLVEGKLEMTGSSAGGSSNTYDHRLDIEGMNEPTYNPVHAVKHFGFLTGKPGIETMVNSIDLSVVQKLKASATGELRRVPLESRLGKLKMEKTGGFYTTDPVEQKAMDGILSDVASKLSKSIMDGNGVAGMSLPVRIFDQKGLLERIIGYYTYAPIYLTLATAAKGDKLERLKLVVTMSCTGFWKCMGLMKPFHPILGETLQAYWEDGTSINVEYTCHIPPTLNFYIADPLGTYALYGRHEIKAKVGANTVTGLNCGPNVVHFRDGDKIEYQLPAGEVSGLLFSSRPLSYMTGDYIIRYPNADLEAHLTMIPAGSGDIPQQIT